MDSETKKNSFTSDKILPDILKILLERLDRIEEKVDKLVSHTHNHTGVHTSTKATLQSLMGGAADQLLVGWAEISRFSRKAPSTLRGYVRTMHFPAYRWGRFVVSHPQMIQNWLLAVKMAKDKGRGRDP